MTDSILGGIKKQTSRLSEKTDFWIIFVANFLILGSVFAVFQGLNFESDSYGIYYGGFRENVFTYISSYRFFSAFILWIINLLGHNFYTASSVDLIFFIVSVSFFMSLLCKATADLIDADKKNKPFVYLLTDIALILFVVNVSAGSSLAFPECVTIFAFGCILTFSSGLLMIKIKKLWQCIFLCPLFVCAAATFQQFYSAAAVIVVSVLVIKLIKSDEKKFFKSVKTYFLAPGIVYFLSGIIYCLTAYGIIYVVAVPSNSRASFNLSNMLSQFLLIIRRQVHILKAAGMIDDYKSKSLVMLIFLFTAAAFLLCLFVNTVKEKAYGKSFAILLAAGVSYICVYIPNLLSVGGLSIRALLALYLMFFFAVCAVLSFKHQNKVINILLVTALSLNIFIQGLYVTKNELHLKEMNILDRAYCEEILGEISKYEEENNITVTKYSVKTDESPKRNTFDIVWSRAFVLSVIAGKDYEYIEMPDDVYEKNFTGKNWDVFDPEQLVFDGDTVWICAY